MPTDEGEKRLGVGSGFVRQSEEKPRDLVVLFAIENEWVRVSSAGDGLRAGRGYFGEEV